MSANPASSCHPLVLSDGAGDLVIAIHGSKLAALRFVDLQEMLPAVELGVEVQNGCLGPAEMVLLFTSTDGRLFVIDLGDDDGDDDDDDDFDGEQASEMTAEGSADWSGEEFDSEEDSQESDSFFELLELTPEGKQVRQCVFIDDGSFLLCLCTDGSLMRGSFDADWELLHEVGSAFIGLQIFDRWLNGASLWRLVAVGPALERIFGPQCAARTFF